MQCVNTDPPKFYTCKCSKLYVCGSPRATAHTLTTRAAFESGAHARSHTARARRAGGVKIPPPCQRKRAPALACASALTLCTPAALLLPARAARRYGHVAGTNGHTCKVLNHAPTGIKMVSGKWALPHFRTSAVPSVDQTRQSVCPNHSCIVTRCPVRRRRGDA